MWRGQKFLIKYFVVLGVLSLIAAIPGAALMVFIFTTMALPSFGVPGFLIIAAPTVLLYSASLVPAWRELTAPQRHTWRVAAALCIPAAVAIAPGFFSHHRAEIFALRMSADDMRRPVPAKPKSIELIGDGTSGLFAFGQAVGDKLASCNDVCRRLLFNREADWVRMTRIPDIYKNKRAGTTQSVTYRIEHRDSCPQFFPITATVDKAVRDRVISGECVIAESGGSEAPDATVMFTRDFSTNATSLKEAPPSTVQTVKQLRIESRDGDARRPVFRQTETVALPLALPFHIGFAMDMQGGYNGPTLGRSKLVVNPIDLTQALRNTLGYGLAEISPPPPEDAGKIAERILALPPESHPVFSAQQQDALNDVLVAMAKQPGLSDADVDLVRRILADKRVTESKLGQVVQTMFRKYTVRLEPLIPVVLARLSTPAPQERAHYESMLGWALANFSVESLQPYRDTMVAVAEAQSDWPGNGVVTRLAELGGDDAVALVRRRLGSEKTRHFAAVAVCRASAEVWPALEQDALAHLAVQKKGNRLQDDEKPLLLALVRFGKKQVAADMIEQRDLFNKARTLDRLAKLEPGFDPKHCRGGVL